MGALWAVALTIDGDYYCSQVLQHVASRRRLEGAARDAYVTAAESIESRHDRQRALAAIERDSR